ncbi:hypothetical protein ACFYSF_48205 [Streptomyces canus]|uniref:hypothetical protein n=1 Tax=Streptomyces canus TaxID=58343 RepID=UPI0036C8DB2A
MVKIFRAANKVVRPLLASRFHKPLSGRLMLLTYEGHRTGRQFTVPIGYFDWDPGTVLAMSSQLGWIPSMREGSTVRLRIRARTTPPSRRSSRTLRKSPPCWVSSAGAKGPRPPKG